jgi:hypothetical protein
MLCLERIVRTPVAVYFIFAGESLVTSYLSKIDWANGFPLDIVELKLQCLLMELRHLQYVANFIFS